MSTQRSGGLVVLACGLALLGACESAPQIRTNADPTANLSSYKTYAYAANPGTNRNGYSTPLTSYFQTAISREMDARGYHKVDGNADLLVNFSTNVQEKTDIQSAPGAPMGYYGYRGGMYAAPDVYTVRYKVGTANIDLVDLKQKKLVWEGVAQGELTSDMMKNPQAAVDMAVRDMFAKFPGHAAP